MIEAVGLIVQPLTRRCNRENTLPGPPGGLIMEEDGNGCWNAMTKPTDKIYSESEIDAKLRADGIGTVQPKETIVMQPRGQLWFALEGICKDFRNYSGLGEKESLDVLIVVLTNMLAEQKTALEALACQKPPEPEAGQ
jgi:hypothetical protein